MSEVPVQKEEENDMTDWWVGTVFFAIFPILLALVISYSRNGNFDLVRILGDGELILCSFSISTPSLISQYNNKSGRGSKSYFYASLIIILFQLGSYISIKTNASNIPQVVFISSGVSIITSILIGFLGENKLKGVRNK